MEDKIEIGEYYRTKKRTHKKNKNNKKWKKTIYKNNSNFNKWQTQIRRHSETQQTTKRFNRIWRFNNL